MTAGSEPSVALQLYTVRHALEADRADALSRLAAAGFTAVETAGPIGTTAALTADESASHGLAVIGSYFLGSASDFPAFVDEQLELGNRAVASMLGPGSFNDVDQARHAADQFSALSAQASSAGARLGYHNHSWEFSAAPGGRLVFDAFLEALDPAVFLQFDYYWARVGGLEPGDAARRYGSRIRRLHVKDGPLSDSQVMTVVGEGAFDVASTIRDTPDLDWVIIAFDEFAGDALDASARSLDFLARSTYRRNGE